MTPPNTTLQAITPNLNPIEAYFNVTPSSGVVTVDGTRGIFQWPDLYAGVSNTTSPYITPYIGNTASGTHIGPIYHYHAINTLLTFSGVVPVLPTGVSLLNIQWNFGDGATAMGNVVTHTYVYLAPNMSASAGFQFSNGVSTYVPKQMSLIA